MPFVVNIYVCGKHCAICISPFMHIFCNIGSYDNMKPQCFIHNLLFVWSLVCKMLRLHLFVVYFPMPQGNALNPSKQQ